MSRYLRILVLTPLLFFGPSQSDQGFINKGYFTSNIMAANDSLCFNPNWRARKNGLISEETKLRNDLAHIFPGVRHEGDENMMLKDVNEWSEKDIISAAIIICMVRGLQLLPQALDHAVDVITASNTAATLDDLRAIDAQAEPFLLDTPVFYQLVMAAALKNNNRPLFRDMLSAAKDFPPPGHHLLFSPERHRLKPLETSSQATFGRKKGYGHSALHGQSDNGCDLWADMIEAGWALPRAYMHIWAVTSPVPASGLRLLDLLVARGVPLEESVSYFAQMYGAPEVFSRVLDDHIPESPGSRQAMLELAAHHGDVKGVRELEVLFEHGMTAEDVNWRPGPEVPVSPPIRREDLVPYRTPLHVAAERGHAGVVEWLIQHGAKASYDYHGYEPLDLARMEKHEHVVAVFMKYPECRASKPWFWKSWF